MRRNPCGLRNNQSTSLRLLYISRSYSYEWVGATVEVGERRGSTEVWSGDERIAVHPWAQQPEQRFTLPGQRSGLRRGDNRPRQEAVTVRVPVGELERCSLDVYELVSGGVG